MIINGLRFVDACDSGDLDLVKYFVSQGVNVRDEDWAVIKASEKGRLYVINYLIEQGINTHLYNDCIFKDAIRHHHIELIKWLINNTKIDPTANWFSEFEVLVYCAFTNKLTEYGREKLFEYLVTGHMVYFELDRLQYFISTKVLDVKKIKESNTCKRLEANIIYRESSDNHIHEYLKQFNIRI